jgi:hypothetical protein
LYLTRLLAAFCVVHELAAPQRAELENVTGEIWWRAVRAAMRSGTPGLLQAYRAQPALAAGFRPTRVDEAMSTLVGLARRTIHQPRS